MQAPGFGGAPTVPGVQQPMAGYQQPGPAAPIQPNYAPLPAQFAPQQGGPAMPQQGGPAMPQQAQGFAPQPQGYQGPAPQQQTASPGYPAPMSQPMGPWVPPQG